MNDNNFEKEEFIFEKKSKYLEFIQGIINRMAECSFKCKEFCILIITALLAVYASIDTRPGMLILFCLLPSTLFWILDSFYLYKERQYRELYKLNESVNIDIYNFNLSTKKKFFGFLKAMFYSISTTPLYSLLSISSAIIGLILVNCGGC